MRSQTSRFPASSLWIQDAVSDGSHRLILSGELDTVGAEELGSAIFQLCGSHMKMLTLDLRKVSLVDSDGVGVVLLAMELCNERGCDFAIVPGPAHVQCLFDLRLASGEGQGGRQCTERAADASRAFLRVGAWCPGVRSLDRSTDLQAAPTKKELSI
jgi:anti-anti-sigma factor